LETEDLKIEFAQWLLNHAPESYKKMYLGYSQVSVVERLTEIDSFFTDLNLFEVNKENIFQKIEIIKHKIGRKERANNPEFEKYDSGKGSGIPKAVIGKKNYFVFLEETFKQTNYWIFQGNSAIYDIASALHAGHLKSWKVAAHKDNIKPGDKVIIWQTGAQAGCYALAEVTSEVGILKEEDVELQHYIAEADKVNATDIQRVKLKITTNLADNPILWSSIKDKSEFSNFKAGNQGTNFSATKEEFEAILNYINNSKNNSQTMNKLLINISWNSKDWKEESEDISNHAWVKAGNIPGESWNFQKEASYNDSEYMYGYAQFTKPLKIEGVSIFVFYSQSKIVGFYGNAAVGDYDLGENMTRNLRGQKDISFVLENKIDDIKDKGFLEDKMRIGQIGFNYLQQDETITNILDKALELNPKQKNEIENLKNWFLKNSNQKTINNTVTNNHTMESPLNQLFYGPPGTGKTYGTIAEAIKIVDNEFFKANRNNREALTRRYQELLITDWKEANGQIAFCTFHQSFTYEDFVEGIKPKTTQNKDIYYDIEPGIFKRICDLADSSKSTIKVKNEGAINWSENDFRKAFFYKLSLGEANNPEDREIYEFCRDNNYISIGFAGAHDLSGKSESEIKQLCEDNNEQSSAGSQLSTFIHGVSIGDYVLISKGNLFVRALARVVGNYEYHDDFPIGYNHFRKVEWVFTDENIPIEEIYHTTLMQRSIYRIDHDKLKKDFFVKDSINEIIPNESIKPYVIVIDEINRGNVASIFGELITLIEPDKRTGADEELQVILPYSKEKFSVPDNGLAI
jgi:hypothetical protein